MVLVFVFFFSFCFCLFWFGFVSLLDCCWCCSCFLLFFGGFKGQVRWPKGPPHLAVNPPHFLFFCFCFCLEGLRVK